MIHVIWITLDRLECHTFENKELKDFYPSVIRATAPTVSEVMSVEVKGLGRREYVFYSQHDNVVVMKEK